MENLRYHNIYHNKEHGDIASAKHGWLEFPRFQIDNIYN